MLFLIVAITILILSCVPICIVLRKINQKLDYILDELEFNNIKNIDYNDENKNR
mgnify:CR=1 FL=1